MIRVTRQDDDWLGVALSATVGLGAGLMAGIVLGELLGNIDSDRLRRVAGRLSRRPTRAGGEDAGLLEQAVREVLEENPTTQELGVTVRALGDGIVELTGAAPDDAARVLAGDLARGVEGADVVVNRILVEGSDVPRQQSTPSSAR